MICARSSRSRGCSNVTLFGWIVVLIPWRSWRFSQGIPYRLFLSLLKLRRITQSSIGHSYCLEAAFSNNTCYATFNNLPGRVLNPFKEIALIFLSSKCLFHMGWVISFALFAVCTYVVWFSKSFKSEIKRRGILRLQTRKDERSKLYKELGEEPPQDL